MQCFKHALILLVFTLIAGFGYGKAWWSYVADNPVNGAALIGFIGLILLGGLVSMAHERGLRLIGGSVVFAGYLMASLS